MLSEIQTAGLTWNLTLKGAQEFDAAMVRLSRWFKEWGKGDIIQES